MSPLTIARRRDEAVVLHLPEFVPTDRKIRIMIVEGGSQVRLSIQADPSINIAREEIDENREAPNA